MFALNVPPKDKKYCTHYTPPVLCLSDHFKVTQFSYKLKLQTTDVFGGWVGPNVPIGFANAIKAYQHEPDRLTDLLP